MHRLGRPSPPVELASFPKAARLDALARAGLPVPAAWVLLPCAGEDAPLAGALQQLELEGEGPWVARMCLSIEDGAESSAAGLGLTLGGLEDLEAIENALPLLTAHAGALDDTLPKPSSPPVRWALMVQRQIDAQALVVCLDAAQCPAYVEVHPDPGVKALDDGRTPSFSGPLESWPHRAVSDLAPLVESLRRNCAFERGLDAELVHDGQSWWVVQVRPLVRALFDDWPVFLSLLEDEDREALEGRWIADFEHNPAPLSFSHRWLLAQLRAARPGAIGEPRDFNGWLYLRTPLKTIAKVPRHGDLENARGTLARLLDTWLPELRSKVLSHERQLKTNAALEPALDAAVSLFMTMGDRYLRDLMPARRLAARLAGPEPKSEHAHPVTLVDKSQHLEVLPLEWDIASPSLADREQLRSTSPLAATISLDALGAGEIELLLGELDDHFFAWGMRPLRAFYLHCAQRLGFDPELVFDLRADELLAACADPARLDRWSQLARARGLLREREMQLQAPAMIVDGLPYPDAGQRGSAAGSGLRGVGIGAPALGRVAHRRSLDELIACPPTDEQVVCLPALTAPAAWVLHRLGIDRIITAHGGAASHGSLMARELGISAIIGARGIAQVAEGQPVLLDTRRGFVRLTAATK